MLTQEQIHLMVDESDLDWIRGFSLDDEAENRYALLAKKAYAAGMAAGEAKERERIRQQQPATFSVEPVPSCIAASTAI